MTLRYAVTRLKIQQRDMAYRFYVTECLRIITENTTRSSGGSFMQAKFSDLINPKPQDDRTGEEIAADIIKRAGLEVI